VGTKQVPGFSLADLTGRQIALRDR